MRNVFLSLLALSTLVGFSKPADAVAIDGGETNVEVTLDLAASGLSGAPFGTATVDAGPPVVFTFPITGGFITPPNAEIEHEGSGVTITGDGTTAAATSITVGNFLIDLDLGVPTGTLFGDVIDPATGDPVVGFTGLDFFSVDVASAGPNGIPLLITPTLAGALSDTFFMGNQQVTEALTGAEFGLGNPNPSLVPVPAALPMLAAGIALIGFMGSRRHAR